jgi:hypothetical protein
MAVPGRISTGRLVTRKTSDTMRIAKDQMLRMTGYWRMRMMRLAAGGASECDSTNSCSRRAVFIFASCEREQGQLLNIQERANLVHYTIVETSLRRDIHGLNNGMGKGRG